MKSAAAIVLGLAATACSHDFDYVEKVEQQSIDNAQQTLGFYIPENQDWKMSSEANVNVTIPGDANETYTVMIFSNNPLVDGIGYYLTKQTLNGGQNLATDVAYPMHLRSLVIGITDSNGKTIYKSASIDNGKVTALSDISAARTRAEEGTFTHTEQPQKWPDVPTPPDFRDNKETDLTEVRMPTFTHTVDDAVYADSVKNWGTQKIVSIDGKYTKFEKQDEQIIYVTDNAKYYAGVSNNGKGTLFIVKSGKKLELGCVGHNMQIYLEENAILDVSNWLDWQGNPTPTTSETPFIFEKSNAAIYMNSGSQIIGEDVHFFNGCKVLNNGGTIDITNLNIDKGATLWNNGTIENVTNLTVNNEDATIYNAPGKTITAANIYMDNNEALLFNQGTVTATVGIKYFNTGAEIVNAGTLISPYLDFNAGGKFLNTDTGITKIYGTTHITNTNCAWENDGDYTSGDFLITNAIDIFNNCKLTVTSKGEGMTGSGTFTFGGDSQNAFVLNSNHSVKTEHMYWGPNGNVYMGANSLWWVEEDLNAICNVTGSGAIGPKTGYAIIKAGSVVYDANRTDGHRWSINYFNNLFVDTDNHFLQGHDDKLIESNQPWYYYSTENKTVKFKFAPHNDPCPITEPITGNCHHGYTPPGTTITEEPAVWSYAFEDNSVRCDFDMNDVVLRVNINKDDDTKFDVTLVAAGCEYDNYVFLGNDTNPISWNGKTEVHDALGAAKGQMVNTGKGVTKTPVTVTIPRNGESANNAHFSIWPYKKGGEYGNTEDQKEKAAIPVTQLQGSGMAPLGIVVPGKWAWPKERICIVDAYSQFVEWATSDPYGANVKATDWYNHPNDDKVIK